MTLTVSMRLDADADGFVRTMRISNAELDKLNRAADEAGREAMDAARGVDRLGDSARRAGRSATDAGRGMQRLARDADAGRAAAAQLRTVLLGLVGIETLRRTIGLADAWQSVRAQVEGMTRETGDFAAVFAGIRDISQETSTYLEDNVTLMRRLAIGGREFAATNQEILQVTETIQQLGQLGQASTEALRAGTLQFSQAMSAGIVRAEEWNSVVENLPELAAALAEAMGMTVGQMRQAVVEGRILSEDVFVALLDMSDDVQRRFDALPRGFRRASVDLRNASLAAAGAIGEGGLTEAMVDLADRLREAVQGSDDLARSLGEVLGAGIGGAADAMQFLVGNIDLAIAGMTAFAAAGFAAHVYRIAAAFTAATGAVARFNVVMSSNPIGLLARLAAIGAGSMLLLRDRTEDVVTATERYEQALNQARELTEDAATQSARLAEQRREEAIATTQAALAEQQLLVSRTAQAIQRQQDVIDRISERDPRPGAADTIARLEENVARLRDQFGEAGERAQTLSQELLNLATLGDMSPQERAARAAADAFERLAEAITGAAAASRALGAVRLGTEQLRQEAEALRAGPDAVARLDRQRAGEAAFSRAFEEAVSAGASQMAAIEAAMARRAAAMDLFDAQAAAAAAGGGAADVEAVERFVEGLERQILALQLQREALVESEEAAIRWRGEVEEGNLARELGRALTEPETAAIRASIDALVDHTAALGRAREEEAARNAQVAEAQRLYDALRDPVDAYRERLAELTGLMPDLVALTGDQAEAQDILGRAMAEAETELRRAQRAASGLGDVYGDLGRVGARALEDLRRGSFEAADALDQLLAVAYRVAVIRPFEDLIAGIDLGALLGLGGVGAPTDIRPPAVRVPQAHGGGTVGDLPATRLVDPRVFADAPRYHRGGLVGDERPVIARRGEVIGWPEQMRAAFGGGDVVVQIVDQRSGGATPEVSETRGPDGRRMIRILLRDEVNRGLVAGDYDTALERGFGLRRRGY